jgi:hypothetical protein
MDLATFRHILRPHVIRLSHSNNHTELPAACERIGLPAPPAEGSKSERVSASYNSLPDAQLIQVANRLLEFQLIPSKDRNAIQDLLWIDKHTPEITKKARREIARALEGHPLYISATGFDQLLDRLWILDDDPLELLLGDGRSLRAAIKQHVHRNPGDWSTEELFEKLGAFESSDHRFALFLEGLSSSDVRPDEAAQRLYVDIVNGVLSSCGVMLRESGIEDGYPTFIIASTREGCKRSPKNIIFASAEKPDIRFRSAMDNDVEIVSNATKVLVYDLPIGGAGLSWRELQRWWAEAQGIETEDEAKASLYRRLRNCLPDSSGPQFLLFESFYAGFGKAVPDLPALLPEVWLHWDPKTVRERGTDALLRFRMDFLMLLPHGIRVVVEVDGKQHYATDKGLADTARYASTVGADRDLKLSGYEVFRFGGAELQGDSARHLVKDFFCRLFAMHGVSITGT